MTIRVAFTCVLFVLACSDQRSVNAPASPVAKALALPTASIEPDPSKTSFTANDTTWHTFRVQTDADSVFVVVNPAGTDSVLQLAGGPQPPSESQCPAKADDQLPKAQDGDLLHLAACGQGATEILVKEHVYDLVLVRYAIHVSADTSVVEPEGEADNDVQSLFGVFGVDWTATGRTSTTDEPEEPPESEGDADDEPDQKEPDNGEPTEPEQIDYDGVLSDQEALVALYDATGGFIFWENTTNWKSKAPLDQWYGVDTDGSGRVIRLDLSDNNSLLGEIPPSIGQLEKLEVLDLSDNLLIETIPPALGNLTNLKKLDLSSNLLEGPIPPELGNLTNLEVLNLEWNLLKGNFPTELGNLTNLQVLRVSGFDFDGMSGCIPSSLRAVPDNDLRWLNLPNCSGSAKIVAGGQRRPGEAQAREAIRQRQARAQALGALLADRPF